MHYYFIILWIHTVLSTTRNQVIHIFALLSIHFYIPPIISWAEPWEALASLRAKHWYIPASCLVALDICRTVGIGKNILGLLSRNLISFLHITVSIGPPIMLQLNVAFFSISTRRTFGTTEVWSSSIKQNFEAYMYIFFYIYFSIFHLK